MEYVVGQEVGIVRGGAYGSSYTFGTVTRVTPGGRVEVTMSWGMVLKFNNKGVELGEKYRPGYLRADVAYLKSVVAKEVACKDAAVAMNAVIALGQARTTWNRESLKAQFDAMKQKMEEAERLVNAIPV